MPSDPKLRPVKWDFDLLRKEFISRPDPLPVPQTGIFDDTLYCMQFNALWMPHILGALEILLQKDSWSGGESELFRAHQAIYTMLANVHVCGEPMRIVELRSVQDGNCNQLQWKYTDEPINAWRNLGDELCDGQDGAPGSPGQPGTPGAPGQPGADGQDCECPPVTPEAEVIPPTNGKSCGGAYGVVMEMIEILNFNITQIDAASDVVNSVVVDQVMVFLSDALKSVPVVGWVIAGLQAAAELGTAVIGAAISAPEFDDDVACALYCAVEDNGGVFNETAFNAWITKMKEMYPSFIAGERGFIDLAENFLRYPFVSRLYAIESLNEDARCAALCNCEGVWCQTWDLTATDGGFVVSRGGVWKMGTGWKTTTIIEGAARKGDLAIQMSFTTATVTKVSVTFSGDNGTIADGEAINNQINLFAGLVNVVNYITPDSYGTNLVMEWTGTAENVDKVLIQLQDRFTFNASGTPGTIRATTFRMEGIGFNPFGSSNC